MQSKNKTAAQFVSHCRAISKRDNVTAKLQELGVEVDVYGSCGNLSCSRGSKHCLSMLNTTYKFYLSFENSLCKDYLTEKQYDAMEQFVIPVSYSGVNYTKFLPPDSFIDADSFKTVEELAAHLKYLEKNPKEMVKYFYWKKHYNVTKVTFKHQACEICKKLNDPDTYKEKKSYKNITDWFFTGSCRTPHIIM